MSMSFGLAATLGTSQKLTPQMQQAIKLLQLSSLELAQEVQAKLDSNPLLERAEDDEGDDATMEGADEPMTLDMWNTQVAATNDDHGADHSSDHDDDAFGDSWDKLTQSHMDDTAIDVSEMGNDSADGIDRAFDPTPFDINNPTAKSVIGGSSFDELDSYQGSTCATIQDHVRWQINFKHLSETDMLIADYLMDAMDDLGFIRLDIDELIQSFDTMASFYQWSSRIERDEVLAVLRIIQSCDPLGVGARDLSECLTIQLNKLDPETAYLAQAKALLTASEYLVSNNIKALTEATGVNPCDITPSLTLLRRLQSAPGLAFQSHQPDYTQPPESYDIPDVLVTPVRQLSAGTLSDDSWQVRLNPETLPKLRVNQEYASLVKRGDDSPDNLYLRDNLVDARLFIRSIEERNQNLLKVATSIIRRQHEFLIDGATAMQPLILKDIAEEVDLHESTVSRLTTSKTILTPQGLFSLKHFFSSHVSSSDGDISSTAISAMIKQMIESEDPKKPLSDSRLQTRLHDNGIDIARRTVAKYREAMNIGSSTQRKQKY